VSRTTRALLLAAGLGTRLRPLTNVWPKCLMPIQGRPLLEHWLCQLKTSGIGEVLVNVHHHADIVMDFLDRDRFRSWVSCDYEPQLLGTAGTLRRYAEKCLEGSVFVAHADNWCQCDLPAFFEFHQRKAAHGNVISMMTFRTEFPSDCGIVTTDNSGIVNSFSEKVMNPPGNLANGAVYILESEALDWLLRHPGCNDISTQFIPAFIGRIAAWENRGIHRDIGRRSSLLKAQDDPPPENCWDEIDDWLSEFERNPIHSAVHDETFLNEG